MNNDSQKITLPRALLVAGTTILVASSAFAQDQTRINEVSMPQNEQFQSIDENGDQRLVWRELEPALSLRMAAAGLDEQQVLEQYDTDNDRALSQQEFDRLIMDIPRAEQLQKRSTARSNERADSQKATRKTLGGGNVRMTPEELEKAIIDRSFDDDVRSDKVTKVQAGSSVFSNTKEPINLNSKLEREAEKRERERGAPSDGTAVIVVDGEVIASTTVDTPQEAAPDERDQAMAKRADNRTAPESTRNRTSDADAANTAMRPDDPRRIYAALKGTPVANFSGDIIGVVDELVVDTESGEAGLVVITDLPNEVGGAEILAPLTEVAITGENVVWQTTQTQADLVRSNSFDAARYVEISAREGI